MNILQDEIVYGSSSRWANKVSQKIFEKVVKEENLIDEKIYGIPINIEDSLSWNQFKYKL